MTGKQMSGRGESPSGVAAKRLRLGTRASALARWQTEWVAKRLQEQGVSVELVLVTTRGDASSRPLGEIGGQGVFTKEIQHALRDRRVDVAVHSLKDLPTVGVPGLMLAAVPERESNQDALVCREARDLMSLIRGARVGTGSLRRRAQLLYHRPDLVVVDIRGNVETRLGKLDGGEVDALVLAEAGLRRLGFQARITQVLPRAVMMPTVGQGALGLEIREGEPEVLAALAPLNHGPSFRAVVAERAFLATLQAGCLAPVGAWARETADHLLLDGVVFSPGGERRLAVALAGSLGAPEELGVQAAERLIGQGADRLISAAHRPASGS